MKQPEFRSIFADRMRRFVALRRSTGAKYDSQIWLLKYFDRFLVESDITSTRITAGLLEDYFKSLNRLSSRVQANRMCVVRQFCEYWSQTDPSSFVPEIVRSETSLQARRPYIYSREDIQALMKASSALKPRDSLRPLTYRVLWGLLYCTGIRIGEACSLDLGDFHREDARLFVRAGKFRKDRWIPLTSSACRALERYLRRRLELGSTSSDSPLLLSNQARRLCYVTVRWVFSQILESCGIPRGGEHGARIHDIRHTFATQRLLQWYQDGEDINARLPWLATYMGHVDIISTQRYLQTTPELKKMVDERFHEHFIRHVAPERNLS